MKKININFADGLASFLLILSLFTPFFANQIKLNNNILTMLINCYLIAYFAYNISFMETKKVGFLFLPLVFYLAFILFYKMNFKLDFSMKLFYDLEEIIIKYYDLIFVIAVFFLIELFLSKVFGRIITNMLAILSLLIYLVMQNTSFLPFDFYYKDLLAYFAFYVMGSQIKPALKINGLLCILSAVLFALEFYLVNFYFKYYIGIYLSLFFLTYIILKADKTPENVSFEKYLLMGFLYINPLVFMLLENYFHIEVIFILLTSSLITFLFTNIFYKIRVKFISYLFLGTY